jgi:hypothetical protein
MLTDPFHKPVTVIPLKIAFNGQIRNDKKQDLLIPIFSAANCTAQKETTENLQNKLSILKIFKIVFLYFGQTVHTKVLKVSYANSQSIYKVVLGSHISKYLRICWLQQGPQGWLLSLGYELDDNLKLAITSAIESQELPVI